MKWNPEDEKRLKELFDKGESFSSLARTFQKTEDALKKKLKRMGLWNTEEIWTEEDDILLRKNLFLSTHELEELFPEKTPISLKKRVLDTLMRNHETFPAFLLFLLREADKPYSKAELLSQVPYSIGDMDWSLALKRLEGMGFDVKTIEGQVPLYVLVRSERLVKGDFYRSIAHVETPLLLTCDWHIGHKNFVLPAFQKMVEDIKTFGIKSVLSVGDQIQGRGVFRGEENELSILRPELMCAEVVKLCRPIVEHAKLYLWDGTHEAATRAWTGGLDATYLISSLLPNTEYVGQIAKMDLNKRFTLVGLHGDGAQTKYASYKIEEMYSTLAEGPEKPDVLVMGHFHRMVEVGFAPYTLLIQPGSFQRETHYIIKKGLVSQIGWKILLEFNEDSHTILTRHPQSL